MASVPKKRSVLFVCLGNTCRSTMAEGIFKHLVKERNLQSKWVIDSAAIASWHVGSPPDPRTMELLEKNEIQGYHHICRQLTRHDFTKFEFIFGMDDNNIDDINELKPASGTAKVQLLGEYYPKEVKIIEDPFVIAHLNKNAFNEVYEQCLKCCTAFLDSVEKM